MTIAQLWREKAEKVLRGWLDLAMFHEYGVPEQPTYGPGELEADTIALLPQPTPTPRPEGGGGEEMVLVHKSNCDIHNGLPCDCSESAKLAMYHELIMAVGKKYPGESRHQTALRYIREAEKCDCEDVARSALNNGAWSGKGTT